jgi:chromate reductase, NAD(P)H dehydrogenase (quinone)
MPQRDVLFVSGSLRRASYNTALLRAAAHALPSGVGQVWLDGLAALPPYGEDDDAERVPAAVERLRRTIAAAGAILIATPEYNGSIPGGLKNAVDWASRPFPDNAWRDKPVAVIGASTGIFGAVWAQAELRKSLGIAGARVLDAELAVGTAHDAFLPSGALRDPALASGLRDVVAALADDHLAPAGSVAQPPVPGVRVADVGRQTRRGQRQRTNDRVPAVEQPMRTGRALRKAHEIAGLEGLLALRVAQAGRAA